MRNRRTDFAIGIAIYTARCKKGYTQKELADKLNVSQASIAQIEQGKRGVDNYKLSRIAKILDMPLGRTVEEGTDF